MPITLDTPLALYSIPAVWYTAFYPVNKKFASMLTTVGYDNLRPRANTKRAEESTRLEKKTAELYARLDGAHMNGMENLPLWIAAVVSVSPSSVAVTRTDAFCIAGLPTRTMNSFAAAYVSTRVLYNYIYINQATPLQSNLRTITFFAGLAMPLALLIKAANKVRIGSGH